MYINFTGTKLSLIDTDSGEVSEVNVFVAILGASQLNYVEIAKAKAGSKDQRRTGAVQATAFQYRR